MWRINFGGSTYPIKVRERRGAETRTLRNDKEGGWIGWALYSGWAGPRGGMPPGGADTRYHDGWRMAGANPERTRRVPENVPGMLQLEWYRPFEPFTSHKVQVIPVDLYYIDNRCAAIEAAR